MTAQRSSRRFHRPMVAALLASVSAGVGFVVFADAVLGPELVKVDAAGRAWATAHRSSAVGTVLSGVTWLANPRAMLGIAVIAAIVMWMRGARWAAASLALAAFLAPLISRTIKPMYGRLRPGYVDAGGRSFSFPSGHTTAATAVALTLAYVMAREGIAPRLAPAVAVLFVLAVGASRVYLQEHWITDVAGAWAVGTAIAAASAAVYELGRAMRNRGARAESNEPAPPG